MHNGMDAQKPSPFFLNYATLQLIINWDLYQHFMQIKIYPISKTAVKIQ